MKRKIRVVAAAMAVALSMHICMPVYAEAMSGAQPDASQNLYRTVNSEVDLDGQTMDEELTEAQGDTVQDNTESTPVPEATPVLEATAIPESTAVPESTPAQESEPEPTQTPVPEETPAPTESAAPTETPVPTQTPAATETPAPESDDIEAENTTTEPSGEEQNTKQDSAVYQDGVILLYTYEQLCAVGSGRPVMTGDDVQFGSGEPVLDEQGQPVLYALDVNYQIVEDIPLESVWTLPADFTGHFVSDEVTQDAPLYDSETDTIYIYHNYQLLTIASEDAAQEPVMSNDIWPEQFGTGQFVYPDGQPEGEEGAQAYLTYDSGHHYVLSRSFTEQMPQMIASLVEAREVDPAQLGGRMHIGQVYVEIDGTKYILIGNEHQLAAIGTDAQVAPRLFVRTEVKILGIPMGTKVIPYYPGDADLNVTSVANTGIQYSDIERDTLDFQYLKSEEADGLWNPDFDSDSLLNAVEGVLNGILGWILGGAEIVGLKGENTATPSIGADDGGLVGKPEYMPFNEVKSTYQDLKYTSDGNYIIFRDIDLNNLNSDTSQSNWVPLTFSGTMIGAKAVNGETLTNGTTITATGRPVISNIRIFQTEALEVDKYMGIGFFATISNEINRNDVGVSAGQVYVGNLELNNVSVQMQTSETVKAETLLNGLTSGLGWIVGGILDLTTAIITVGNVKLNLKETLSGLLNARAENPTRFATGAFAGRIEGDVRVQDCLVTNATVTNQNDYTGGFVGYSVGVTEYDGLSDALGLTANVLASLLNAIPGLGLGDLITVLLGNALPVGNLVPTGYYNPIIENCQVRNLNEAVENHVLGSSERNYAGGFVGAQVGTQITDCAVLCNAKYTVQAANYAGGFAGLARDAEIKGLLTDIGVELVRVTQPQSLLLECQIQAPGVTVAGENNQGGFVGALANSYAINDNLSAELSVTGTGSCVGGFTGIATVGWISNLGQDSTSNSSLLSTVKTLLAGLISSDPNKAQMLLSLVGIQPSAVMGCGISGSNIQVSGENNYVGGMIGKGDGVYLTTSSQSQLAELSLWKRWDENSNPAMDPTQISEEKNQIIGLSSVTATGNYAGGIAGSLGTASVAGLLNETLGVASFLGFTVDSFALSGPAAGLTVTADRYAGGAFGEAVGGNASNVSVSNLSSVTAGNYAAGFVGVCGPGDLAGTGGLTLNLLGLNNLLKVDSLLSVIPGVKVELTDCSVTGLDAGYMVKVTQTDTTVAQDYVAGGVAAHCNRAKLMNCPVVKLASVTAANQPG